MDNKFLQETVGDQLAAALTAVCVAQPQDPIEYIGNWLLKYVENVGRQAKLDAKAAQLKVEQEIYAEKMRVQEKEKEEAEATAEKLEEEKEEQRSSMLSTTVDDEIYEKALSYLTQHTNIENAYIGRLEPIRKLKEVEAEEGGGEEGGEEEEVDKEEIEEPQYEDVLDEETGEPILHVRYVAASEKQKDLMVGKTLEPKEGITWPGLNFKAEPVEEEEPEETPPEPEEEPDTEVDEPEDGEGGEEGEKDGEGDEEITKAPAPPEPPKDPLEDFLPGKLVHGKKVESSFVLREKNMKFFGVPRLGAYLAIPLVKPNGDVIGFLGVDTMGQDREFTSEECEVLDLVARLLGANLERAATARAEAEAAEAARKEAEHEAFLEEYAEKQAELQKELEEAEKHPEGIEEEEEEKNLRLSKLQVTKVVADLLALDKGKIAEIASYKVPPQAVHKVMKAVFHVLGGHTVKELNKWSHVRQLLDSSFLEKIESYDPEPKQKVIKFKRAAKCISSLEEDGVKKSSIAAFLLWQWVTVTLKAREDAVAMRRAAAERAGETPDDEDNEEDEEAPAAE